MQIKRFPSSAGSGPGSSLQKAHPELQKNNNLLVINMDSNVNPDDILMNKETRNAMVFLIGLPTQNDDKRTHKTGFYTWADKHKLTLIMDTAIWKHFRDEAQEYQKRRQI